MFSRRPLNLVLISIGIGLILGAPSFGQPKDKKVDPSDLISFQVSLSAGDPFHAANQRGKKIQARRGEIVRLKVTGVPKKGYHTYPVTMRSSNQDPAGLTHFTYGDTKGLAALWPIEESEPEQVDEKPLGVYLEHGGSFSLAQDILILPDAPPGLAVLPIHVRSQVCKDTCTWVETDLKGELEITNEDPVPMSGQLQSRLGEHKPDITVVAAKVPENVPMKELAPEGAKAERSLFQLIA